MDAKKITPTPAELEILNVLWSKEPLTVKEIHEQLAEKKDVGYTTILKIMQNMTAKKLLTRTLVGRSHVYSTVYKKEDTQRTLLNRFIDTAFGGSASSLVMQLLGNKKTSEEELQEIKAIIKQLEQDK